MAPKRSGLGFDWEFVLGVIWLIVAGLSVVAGGAYWRWQSSQWSCVLPAGKADLQSYRMALTAYRSMAGMYPSTAQGLKALVARPEGEPKPQTWHAVLPDLRKDPWSRDFIYQCPSTKHPESYDLYCRGEDGKAGTEDDICPN